MCTYFLKVKETKQMLRAKRPFLSVSKDRVEDILSLKYVGQGRREG